MNKIFLAVAMLVSLMACAPEQVPEEQKEVQTGSEIYREIMGRDP